MDREAYPSMKTSRSFLRRLADCAVAAVCISCGESSVPTSDTAPTTAVEPPQAPKETETKTPNVLADAVDALFTEAEAKDAFSGSVVVVDAGKQVLEKGYGFADRTAKRKNTPATRFHIGSVSKQFAATAILALVEDGKLALGDPVSKFFPAYPRENLEMDGQPVTIHHLISHTSGLPDPGATAPFKSAVWRRPIAPSEQIDFVKGQPLVRKPGSAYQYVNYNFLLAALIVEHASKVPYEQFLRERFFGPLGMEGSGTLLPAREAGAAAVGYAADRNGALTALADNATFNKDPDVTFAFGSGQIYSTVHDLALWDRALTGEVVLNAKERDLLFQPNRDRYAYGWVVEKKAGITVEWHNGALSPLGFTALVVRIPSKDRFVAYLSNFDLPLVEPFEAKVLALAIQ